MAIERQILLTEEERERLQSELNQLIFEKRPIIAEKIGRAAADGDLSENGAYHDAKEQQGHIEGRIQELEHLLRNARVVAPRHGVVGIGNTVHIEDETGQKRSFRVVSKHSARPSEGLISGESPIGSALMGHGPGETVTYATPNGQQKSVTLLSIE